MIVTLNQHPLLKQWYRLMRKTDALPAHPEQTDLITKLGAWGDSLKAHLQKHGLLRDAPPVAEGAVEVLKVTHGDGGPYLILRRSEVEALWDYFGDWQEHDKVTLEFLTMPEAEVAALPEFSGF
jgi:hypothetical protein